MILLEHHGSAGGCGLYGLSLLLAHLGSGLLRALEFLLQCLGAGLRGAFDNLANVVSHAAPSMYRRE